MDDSEEAEHSESKDGIVTILLGEETERNTKEPSETKENQAEGCIGDDRNKTNEFKVKEEERGEKLVVMSDKTGMSCRSWDFKRNAEVTESSDEKSMVGSDFDEGIAGRNTKDEDNDETDSNDVKDDEWIPGTDEWSETSEGSDDDDSGSKEETEKLLVNRETQEGRSRPVILQLREKPKADGQISDENDLVSSQTQEGNEAYELCLLDVLYDVTLNKKVEEEKVVVELCDGRKLEGYIKLLPPKVIVTKSDGDEILIKASDLKEVELNSKATWPMNRLSQFTNNFKIKMKKLK